MPRVRVLEVVRETADAHTLVIEPVSGDALQYAPGQFLTVRVPTAQAQGAARCYSLCTSPHGDDRPAITVKRTAGGFASNWICDHVVAGTELDVLRPAGTFVPRDLDADLLLLAAGSGITPVLSIAKSVLRAGRGRVQLVYANRDEASVIFRDLLASLAEEHAERFGVVHWLESVQGLPRPASLRALLAPYADREAFLCGPQPFMDLATTVLRDIGADESRLHVERFVSIDGDPFAEVEVADDAARSVDLEVTLDGTTTALAWPSTGMLLDVLLAAGVAAPFSCREGNCSACACVVLDGEVELAHNQVLDETDLAEGLILACQARPRSSVVRVSFDG
ncbi:MAG TPA: ferredoxin--NADP reductase [Marmoricola sp.]|nr:ferredoxin--NADP reductase [Marmoricola sp.]